MNKPCTSEHQEPLAREEHNGEQPAVSTPVNEIVPSIRERDFPEPPPDVTGVYLLFFRYTGCAIIMRKYDIFYI